MKFNYIIKAIPFLSTLILIIFLNISNQKVNTKLRILIWNTPSLSLGKYLAISTGAGFILSYIVTSNLAHICRFKSNKSLNYKPQIFNNDNTESNQFNYEKYSEKTLIEREINDPSPTINAKFRVIGNKERYNSTYVNKTNLEYEESNDLEDQYIEDDINIETINQEKENFSDWNDDSFASW